MCEFVCACVFRYRYRYIDIDIDINTHIDINIHIHIYVHIHLHLHIQIHIIHTRTHTHTHTSRTLVTEFALPPSPHLPLYHPPLPFYHPPLPPLPPGYLHHWDPPHPSHLPCARPPARRRGHVSCVGVCPRCLRGGDSRRSLGGNFGKSVA